MALSLPSFRKGKKSLFDVVEATTINEQQQRRRYQDHPSLVGGVGSTVPVPEAATETSTRMRDDPSSNSDNGGSDDESSSSSSSDDSILSTTDIRTIQKQQINGWQRRRRNSAKYSTNNGSITPSDNQKDKQFFRVEQKLKRRFHYRNQIWKYLLSKCKRNKRSVYLYHIQQREYTARCHIIDSIVKKLSRNELYDGNEVEQFRRRCYLMMEEDRSVTPTTNFHPTPGNTRNTTRIRWAISDSIIIAMNTFLPATFSIIVHCIVHAGLYDGVSTCLELVKMAIMRTITTQKSEMHLLSSEIVLPWYIELMWICSCFLFGVLLLRSTGDIYWWSSNFFFNVVKFDFHNRRQLLTSNQYMNWCTITRLVIMIRSCDMLRAMIFMLGYTCSYVATGDLLRFIKLVFIGRIYPNWNHTILLNLPSTMYIAQYGQCSPPNNWNESVCTHSCQKEISQRGT
jgi:hypothetical protein